MACGGGVPAGPRPVHQGRPRQHRAGALTGHRSVGSDPLVRQVGEAGLLDHNARSEELSTKASYKHSWQYGKRCIIPAMSFDEPNWETGKNIWWRFRRADGAPWALAGLWNTWTDKVTGEMVESYTMLTLNADDHPLMSRMHKPDPKLGLDEQDKRSVVPIELEDVDAWLHGTQERAQALVRLAPAEAFDAGPVGR